MSKHYFIKEIFGPTIQGEGLYAGTPCAFLRFSGCNKWSGLESDRANSDCPFCDTDFTGGNRLTIEDILSVLKPFRRITETLIVSGGEPLLQFDEELFVSLVGSQNWQIHVETNGSIDTALPFRHICMSPKQSREKTALKSPDAIKILYPHQTITPEEFASYSTVHKFLQPMWDENGVSTDQTIQKLFELGDPWRLSLQLHKYTKVR